MVTGTESNAASERAAATTDAARTTWPRVRAIVLNYNGYPHVLDSVEALVNTDWPQDRLEIVVVDNGSTDDSVEDIVEAFPQVKVILNPANNGFPANNLALADRTGFDFLALINNDAFVEPGWLAPLVSALERDPALGAVSAKILFAPRFGEVLIESETFMPPSDTRDLGVYLSGIKLDGRDLWDEAQLGSGFWYVEHTNAGRAAWTKGLGDLHVPFDRGATRGVGTLSLQLSANERRKVEVSAGSTGHGFTVGTKPAWFDLDLDLDLFDIVNNAGNVLIEGGFGADRGFKRIDDGSLDQAADIFAWCGNGVVFRPSYLQDVGLFDEDFFAYYEDTDMAWRGRARGWRYRYVPTSRIRHMHATTSGEGSSLFQHYVERNRLLMLAKNAPASMAVGAVGRYLSSTGSYAVNDIVRPLSRGRRPTVRPTLRRARSFGGFLRQLPTALGQRRANRRRQSVSDEQILSWTISQDEHR